MATTLDDQLSAAQHFLRDGYRDEYARAVAEARNLLNAWLLTARDPGDPIDPTIPAGDPVVACALQRDHYMNEYRARSEVHLRDLEALEKATLELKALKREHASINELRLHDLRRHMENRAEIDRLVRERDDLQLKRDRAREAICNTAESLEAAIDRLVRERNGLKVQLDTRRAMAAAAEADFDTINEARVQAEAQLAAYAGCGDASAAEELAAAKTMIADLTAERDRAVAEAEMARSAYHMLSSFKEWKTLRERAEKAEAERETYLTKLNMAEATIERLMSAERERDVYATEIIGHSGTLTNTPKASRTLDVIVRTFRAEQADAANERDTLRDALDLANADLAVFKADLEAAAGELRVPLPEPGTDTARLVSANRLLSHERNLLVREAHESDEALTAIAEANARIQTWVSERGHVLNSAAFLKLLADLDWTVRYAMGDADEPPKPVATPAEAEIESDDWTDNEKCIKCGTALAMAPGIGPYCPNRACDAADNQTPPIGPNRPPFPPPADLIRADYEARTRIKAERADLKAILDAPDPMTPPHPESINGLKAIVRGLENERERLKTDLSTMTRQAAEYSHDARDAEFLAESADAALTLAKQRIAALEADIEAERTAFRHEWQSLATMLTEVTEAAEAYRLASHLLARSKPGDYLLETRLICARNDARALLAGAKVPTRTASPFSPPPPHITPEDL